MNIDQALLMLEHWAKQKWKPYAGQEVGMTSDMLAWQGCLQLVEEVKRLRATVPKWKREKPTKPGLYRLRDVLRERSYVAELDDEDGDVPLTVYSLDETVHELTVDALMEPTDNEIKHGCHRWEWFGPLP